VGKSSRNLFLFEALSFELVKILIVYNDGWLLNIYDNNLWAVIHCNIKKARDFADYSNFKRMVVDKKPARRGHVYFSQYLIGMNIIGFTFRKDGTAKR
jgi:hypothetical protein